MNSIKQFFWVLKHWRLYYDTIQCMHNEWFSIDVEGPMCYMSDPDSLYCKYCGCKYVRQTSDRWDGQMRQQHMEGCIHFDILKLRGVYR